MVLLSLGLSSCERDDICPESTPTTPLLVIEFVDVDNPSEPKIPSNLIVAEQGASNGLSFNTATISIPLRTNMEETNFVFVLNNGSQDPDAPQNVDQVIFNYTIQEEYVSKACGFRVLYEALQTNIVAGEDDFWIQDFIILNPNIEDETTTHLRILH